MNRTVNHINCNLCHSSDIRYIYEDLKIAQCKHCGLIYVVRAMADNALDTVATLAGNWYGKHDVLSDTHSFLSREKWIAKLTTLKGYKERGNILDVGCSTGAFLNAASSLGWTAFGVEASDKLAGLGRDLRLNIITGDFLQVELSEEHFDVVTMWNVIDHMTDPKLSLSKAYKLLRQGGALALTALNIASLTHHLIKERWFVINPNYHLYYFSRTTLQKMLRETGFAVRCFKTVGIDPYYLMRIIYDKNHRLSTQQISLDGDKFYSPIRRRPLLLKAIKALTYGFVNLFNLGDEISVLAEKGKQ